MKFLLTILLLGANAFGVTLIPSENQTDWTPGTYVGVPGGYAQYSSRTVVMVTNLDTTGATDVSSGLQSFIDNATSGTILQLTNGTYRCDSTIYFDATRDGITLRGNGPSTIVDSRSTSYSFYIGTASDYTWSWPSSSNTITAGVSKGSTNVTIGDTSEFSVGQMIHFVFVNGTNADEPVISVYNFDGMRRQKCKVTAKTGTTLTFWPPLYDNYRSDGAQVFVAQFQTDNVGLEDFTLVCSNGPAQTGIEWEQCVGCWAKGVRVKSAINYPFFLYDSLNCEITECFADQRNGEGSNGAGVLCNTSSGCYVYNNIAYKFFPIMEINHGSCGNVFAYNFLHDSTVFGGEGAGIDCNHGPHNSFNLYEGNIAPSIQCDGYFGSASKDTFYRNWFHGTDPGLGFGFAHAFNRFTRKYAMVGNLFGVSGATAGYSFGNPNMGNSCYVGTASHINGPDWIDWTNYLTGNYTNGVVNACDNPDSGHGFIELDLDVSNTTFRAQNYLSGVGIPSDEQTNVTLSASAYLSAEPTWWPNTLTYPPISLSLTNTISESTLTNGDYLLPAQVAFYNDGVWPDGTGGGGTASRPGAIVKGKATIKNNLRQR